MNGCISTATYGVVGDGIEDDGDALQRFFDAVARRPAGIGLLAGRYGNRFRTTRTLFFGSSSVIIGTGQDCVIDGRVNGPVLAPWGASGRRNYDVCLSNFTIEGNRSGYPNVTGVSLQNASDCQLDHVTILDCHIGVDVYNSCDGAQLDASNYNRFRSVNVQAARTGWIFEDNANANAMIACRTGAVDYPVIDYGNRNSATQCQFEVFSTGIWCRVGPKTFSIGFASIANGFEVGQIAHCFEAGTRRPTRIAAYHDGVTTEVSDGIEPGPFSPVLL